jgi:hypothetical protein
MLFRLRHQRHPNFLGFAFRVPARGLFRHFAPWPERFTAERADAPLHVVGFCHGSGRLLFVALLGLGYWLGLESKLPDDRNGAQWLRLDVTQGPAELILEAHAHAADAARGQAQVMTYLTADYMSALNHHFPHKRSARSVKPKPSNNRHAKGTTINEASSSTSIIVLLPAPRRDEPSQKVRHDHTCDDPSDKKVSPEHGCSFLSCGPVSSPALLGNVTQPPPFHNGLGSIAGLVVTVAACSPAHPLEVPSLLGPDGFLEHLKN